MKSAFNHKFALWVAKRYLFSKKSHNAINIISAISAAGVCVGSAALICVLSVFNGFEGLVQGMFSVFDPDLKIVPVEGKIFDADTPEFQQIKTHPSVVTFAEAIEETALLRFGDRQMPVRILGVSADFPRVTQIDTIMYDGMFSLHTSDAQEKAVLGIGVANQLGINAHLIDPLAIYAPKRTRTINIVRPETSFNTETAFVSGIFRVNQPEYDMQNVIVSLTLARKLFEYDQRAASNLQLKLKPTVNQKAAQRELQQLAGSNFRVLNKYQQQEDFFRITKIEKWITYLILSFILMIAAFNIIGSLSMLILEKKDDIDTLRSLGATEKLIKRIFLFEGWMITALGALIGILLGTAVILAQQHFGFIKLGGDNYVVNAYPVILSAADIAITLASVLLMGFLAALYPVKYIAPKAVSK